MKVFFHSDFYSVYTSDPAAAEGRMEAIMAAIDGKVEIIEPEPASEEDILLAHTEQHLKTVKKQGLFHIAALAAGGAIQSAIEGLQNPSFAAIRPPGHHASMNSAWGFCFFSNMAITFLALQNRQLIKSGFILDIDMHFGDGTNNILKDNKDIIVHNVETEDRDEFMKEVTQEMERCRADLIGISAGFDNHINDWGGGSPHG